MQKMAYAGCISAKIERNYFISVILKEKFMPFYIAEKQKYLWED